MTLASTSTSRWAVSARTSGEVLTAEVAKAGVRLVVLGVPERYSSHELEGWLTDLAGVALETSRSDSRPRSIPALLHHALTGLLFSHAELWDRLDGPRPCSCAFIDTPDGASFGWVGDARVHVLVDGDPVEPLWVHVRNDAGSEARAAFFGAGREVVLSLQYWSDEPNQGAPVCSIEAEWTEAEEDETSAAPARTAEPAVAAQPASDTEVDEIAQVNETIARMPAPPLPDSLPQQQPGLAAAPAESASRAPAPVAATPAPEAAAADAVATPGEAGPAEGLLPRAPHPVARWLSRVMRWGQDVPRTNMPVAPANAGGTPVSAYDSLLSESVPPTPVEPDALEQTALALPAQPAAKPAGGFAAAYASHKPAAEGPSESDNEARLSAILREIESIDIAALPVLAPEVPAHVLDAPVEVDHEPVGADETFAIPPLPEAPAPSAPAASPERVFEMAQLPPAISPRLPEDAAPEAPLEIEPPVARTPAPAPARNAPLPAASIVMQPSRQPAAAPLALEQGFGFMPPSLAVPADAVERDLPRAVNIESPPMLKVAVPAPLITDLAASPEEDPMFMQLPPAGPRGTRTPRAFEASPEPRRAFDFGATRAADGSPLPWFRRPPVWAGGVLGVFLIGWLVGSLAIPGADRGGPVMAVLRAVGIGGAHFTATINSRPGGAQIEIDGKPQASRTPATIELPPGEHAVKLLMPGLGSVTVPLKAKNGEKVTIDESLNGSLEVLDPDASVPISVSLDGKPVGYAPLKLESVEPGLHEVHFTGPGMPAFAQTVEIGIHGTAQIVARPMSAPADGVIQVQATLNDERGATPLPGAQVFVDGQLRGVTPLGLDLPRGPHSLRVTWRDEAVPVQVIDLPGGNQRFASFNFGLDSPEVSVIPVSGARVFSPGQPKLVSATVKGLAAADVGEAWLRVRAPEGLWRRFTMTLVHGAGAPVVTGVFPDNAFDARSSTRWYVSVVTPQGDEYFSEMQESSLAGAVRAPAPKPQPAETP